MSKALSELSRVSYVWTSTFGFIWATRSFATSSFFRPTSFQIADVFLVHVCIHKVPKAPVFGKEMAAQLIVTFNEVRESLADALRFHLDRISVLGILSEGGRDDDPHARHGPFCQYGVILKVRPAEVHRRIAVV